MFASIFAGSTQYRVGVLARGTTIAKEAARDKNNL